MDHPQKSIDADPNDHLWRCLTVTQRKIQCLDPNDMHMKVKAIWGDGEESWKQADALCIQDPYLLVVYAVKHRLTQNEHWKWTGDYLQDDDQLLARSAGLSIQE